MALGALAVLVGGTVALAVWVAGDEGDDGPHRLRVVGPRGVLWDHVQSGGTPVAVLLDAAADGLAVEVQGRGDQAFVVMIGHFRAGNGGWCYRVDEGDGPYSPGVGAGAFALSAGSSVEWYWTDRDCDPFA